MSYVSKSLSSWHTFIGQDNIFLDTHFVIFSKGMFEIMFDGHKNIYNIQKVRLKKKTLMVKKLKAFLMGQKLKNEIFAKSYF
jgi:hypothetical protein